MPQNHHNDHYSLYYDMCGQLLQYNVINPCKRKSYYICGKLRVTFVVGSGYYVCRKLITFVDLLH